MSAPRERRIALPHIEVAALEWGDGGAPPLIALHGWLDNAMSFARVAPHLAERFHVIALDLPGHGASDHLPPGASYHFVDYVRTVVAALDALALPRAALLGHSLGAGVAALVASAVPERIERLWLIEGIGPLGDDGSRTLDRFRGALGEPAPHAATPRTFASVEEVAAARTRAAGLAAELALPIVQRNLRAVPGGWQWRSDPRLTRPSPVRLAETQVRALLAGITAPTALLLADPATPYLPHAMMRERAARVPRIQVEVMAGGHHLQLEHPEAVAHWLLHAAAA